MMVSFTGNKRHEDVTGNKSDGGKCYWYQTP